MIQRIQQFLRPAYAESRHNYLTLFINAGVRYYFKQFIFYRPNLFVQRITVGRFKQNIIRLRKGLRASQKKVAIPAHIAAESNMGFNAPLGYNQMHSRTAE